MGPLEMAVGRMTHRANNRRPINHLGRPRHRLAKLDTGQGRGNRTVGSTKFDRGIRLGIKCLELAGPTPQPDLNDGRIFGNSASLTLGGLQAEDIRQR